MALTRNMSATWVTTGLVGILASTVYAQDGTVLQARTTAGITESPAGSGVYVALIDPTWSGRIVWDDGTNFSGEDFTALTSGGSSGSGPIAWTVAVTDGVNPLLGVVVSMTSGPVVFSNTTGSNGNAVFGVNAGSYVIAVTKDGYSAVPMAVNITVAGTTNFVMTANVVSPPPLPNQTVAVGNTLDPHGEPVSGSVITLRMVENSGTNGEMADNSEFTYTSDVNGVIQATLIQGATYLIKRDDGDYVKFVAADTPTSVLPELLGSKLIQ